MVRRYEMIVFDWDGTLMDSAGAIVDAICAACRDLAVAEPSVEEARHVIGLGLSDALKQAVPGLSEERYPEMVQSYRHHYLSRDQDLSLFSGVESMLSDLAQAGFVLAVATGKSRLGLERALQVSGMTEVFHATRCADECFSKPHPQMLHELMVEMGVSAKDCLMIGDTSHDLLMAQNASVDALAVSYGAHPADHLRLHDPIALVDSVDALSSWLNKNA
jgi:phosphoglycolate phosphatase